MNDSPQEPVKRRRPQVCYFRHKVPYWSEEDADLACRRYEDWQGDAMKSYRCCDHWHIAHRQRKLSMKNRHKYVYCPQCKGFNKRVRAWAHVCREKVQNESHTRGLNGSLSTLPRLSP